MGHFIRGNSRALLTLRSIGICQTLSNCQHLSQINYLFKLFSNNIVEREVPRFSNNCALPDTSMTFSAFVLQTCLVTKLMLANAIFSIFKMATMIFKMAVKMIII